MHRAREPLPSVREREVDRNDLLVVMELGLRSIQGSLKLLPCLGGLLSPDGLLKPVLKELDVNLDAVAFESKAPSTNGVVEPLAQLKDAGHPLLNFFTELPDFGNDDHRLDISEAGHEVSLQSKLNPQEELVDSLGYLRDYTGGRHIRRLLFHRPKTPQGEEQEIIRTVDQRDEGAATHSRGQGVLLIARSRDEPPASDHDGVAVDELLAGHGRVLVGALVRAPEEEATE